jgi:hypothetical protein
MLSCHGIGYLLAARCVAHGSWQSAVVVILVLLLSCSSWLSSSPAAAAETRDVIRCTSEVNLNPSQPTTPLSIPHPPTTMTTKFNPSQWLHASIAESFAGTEDITSPAALALLKQSKLLPFSLSPPLNKIKVFDNGCGIGQLTEVLVSQDGGKRKEVEIIAGDIESSLLEAVEDKKKEGGWGNVKVDRIDAMVSLC